MLSAGWRRRRRTRPGGVYTAIIVSPQCLPLAAGSNNKQCDKFLFEQVLIVLVRITETNKRKFLYFCADQIVITLLAGLHYSLMWIMKKGVRRDSEITKTRI